MCKIKLLKIVILLYVIIFNPFKTNAQQQCKVLLHEISGKYEGDCKKGLAHGVGKAIGRDTYEGEIKKRPTAWKGKIYLENR